MKTQTQTQTEKTPRKRCRGGDVADPGIYFDRGAGAVPAARRAARQHRLHRVPAAGRLPDAGRRPRPEARRARSPRRRRPGAGAAPRLAPARAFISHGRPRKEGAAEEKVKDEWAEAARREAAAALAGLPVVLKILDPSRHRVRPQLGSAGVPRGADGIAIGETLAGPLPGVEVRAPTPARDLTGSTIRSGRRGGPACRTGWATATSRGRRRSRAAEDPRD